MIVKVRVLCMPIVLMCVCKTVCKLYTNWRHALLIQVQACHMLYAGNFGKIFNFANWRFCRKSLILQTRHYYWAAEALAIAKLKICQCCDWFTKFNARQSFPLYNSSDRLSKHFHTIVKLLFIHFWRETQEPQILPLPRQLAETKIAGMGRSLAETALAHPQHPNYTMISKLCSRTIVFATFVLVAADFFLDFWFPTLFSTLQFTTTIATQDFSVISMGE